MEDRRPGEGRYAHVEREQRCLVRQLPEEATRAAVIVDRYLLGTRLRLRRTETDELVVRKLGQKVRANPSDPEVIKITNIYLSQEEYEALGRLPGAELHKTRWHLTANGRTWAIDQFHDRLLGLLLAEVELDVDEDHLPLPWFAVNDVTNDDRFSGGALAFSDDEAVRSLLTEVRMAIGA